MSDAVLITGMSGLIGSALRRELEATTSLTALNRQDVPGVPTTRASLDDYATIFGAFENKKTFSQ